MELWNGENDDTPTKLSRNLARGQIRFAKTAKQKQKILVDLYKWYLSKLIFKSCSCDVGVEIDSFVEGLDVTVGSVQR